MTLQYENFAEAYRGGLELLLATPAWTEPVIDDTSVGSDFGSEFRRTLELRPFVFQVADPASCLIECSARQPDLSYAVGQWVWLMTGSDDLAQITYYNQRGQLFSEDGVRLPGAFGARMRRSAGDQLDRALRLLRRDPGTRRASVLIAEAGDSRSTLRDFPCAIGVHLMLRAGKLEMVTSMRSQSALMVLPYDASLFMMLHVWAAGALGVACGPHTWISNSFHIYEDEVPLAHAVLDSGLRAASIPSRVEAPEVRITELIELERRLREQPDSSIDDFPALTHRGEFHGALASVLVATARARCAGAGAPEAALPSDWRPLWTRRKASAA